MPPPMLESLDAMLPIFYFSPRDALDKKTYTAELAHQYGNVVYWSVLGMCVPNDRVYSSQP